jgi:hypothetical protein
MDKRNVARMRGEMDKRFALCPAYMSGSAVYVQRLSKGFYYKERAEVHLMQLITKLFEINNIFDRHGTSTYGFL